MERPRLNVKTYSQVFHPHPSTSLKGSPEEQGWHTGSQDPAVRQTRSLSHSQQSTGFSPRQRCYTKPSEPTDEICDPKSSTVAFPTQRRPTNGRHIEKQSQLPITTISIQVRQLPKQTAAQKTILGSKYKWLVQWHAECSSPKEPCRKVIRRWRSALSQRWPITEFQS